MKEGGVGAAGGPGEERSQTKECTTRDEARDELMLVVCVFTTPVYMRLQAGYKDRYPPNITVHRIPNEAIRRELGKKLDELFTEVQRSQHLT